MTRNRLITLVGAVLIVAAVGLFVFFHLGSPEEAEADTVQTASVTVAPVTSHTIQDVVSIYGVVQADPAGAMTLAAPRAVIITRVLVRPGETVAAGQALIEVTNAPASDLAYKQATDAVAFAQADLARVQRLYNERLVASDQLGAAQKALADAQGVAASQASQGAGRASQTLTASQAAIVTSIPVAAGDHVAQDAPMMVLARAGAGVVRLGLEPGSGRIAAGQAVTLRPIAGGPAIASRISMIGRTVDPATKTLDGIAPLNGASLPIGAAVQGDIIMGAHNGLIIPRAAVVFDETGPHVFIVSAGKARRVFVEVGADQGDGIEIKGQVAAGAMVAVEGAYELQDGMALKVRGS